MNRGIIGQMINYVKMKQEASFFVPAGLPSSSRLPPAPRLRRTGRWTGREKGEAGKGGRGFNKDERPTLNAQSRTSNETDDLKQSSSPRIPPSPELRWTGRRDKIGPEIGI